VLRDTIKLIIMRHLRLSTWVVSAVAMALAFAPGIAAPPLGSINCDPGFNYYLPGLSVFVPSVLFYGIIAIHDVPYEIAKQRDHPHQDAIRTVGGVSLFTLHMAEQARLSYQSQIGGAQTQVARLRAALSDAEFNLELTTARAPGPGGTGRALQTLRTPPCASPRGSLRMRSWENFVVLEGH
jgi:hypothetical protein